MATPRCEAREVSFDRRDYTSEATLLKALSDPTRLAIVSTLAKAKGEVCVCDFTDALPMNQSSVSHHLKILRDAGVVRGARRGTWVHYSLSPGLRRRLSGILSVVFQEEAAA